MYTQSITRSHRTAFILAIDQSGSMAEKLLFQAQKEISFNTSGRKEADFSTA